MVARKHHGSLSPEFALLGLLYDQPSHGYELHRQLTEELGYVWHISLSQTYNILNRMEIAGDITSSSLDNVKLPPRQVVQITLQGRERFDDWLDHATESSVRAIRLEFITRLYFVRKFHPQRTALLLDAQVNEINSVIKNLERIQSELPATQLFNFLSMKLRINQLRSALEWIGECRNVVGDSFS